MEENEHRRTQHRENTEQQCHARRQCRRRNQDRSEEEEGKRILQTAREVKQRRKLGDIETQEIGGAIRLQPLGLGETDAQHDVEKCRQRDHRETRPDRNVEFEAEMHHQDGRDLTEHGKPAQPHQRVEPHVPWPMIGPRQSEHAANVAIAGS